MRSKFTEAFAKHAFIGPVAGALGRGLWAVTKGVGKAGSRVLGTQTLGGKANVALNIAGAASDYGRINDKFRQAYER